MPRHHPPRLTLELYAAGELPPGAALVVELHLMRCAGCSKAISRPSDGGSQEYRPALPTAGPWRWAGWGVQLARCEMAEGLGEYLYYTKARPGASLGSHAHEGTERIVVLEGAFLDGEGLYAVGDFSERGQTGWHSPKATDDGICLCLVASDAKVRLKGVARLMQPFLRI